MLKSIKTSENNRVVVTELTNKLGMGPENLIARIALTFSISQGRKLNLSEAKDSKGKEYSSKVLFGSHPEFYTAIICQHYGIHKTDANIAKYVKMHIDDGLELIAKAMDDNPNLPIFDFILDHIDNGLAVLAHNHTELA